ncbi:MAG: class I SAM-dependent methyltransferase [Lachnospiraceae bacterium]|nr:class I SAM-dependent methyltransferase [Lachnospiraceae bacterium]
MKHCIACGKELPKRSLFELDGAPASAQDIPDETQVRMDRGVTLHLYQCEDCGLVQFDCEPVAYYKDVIRAGGFSTTMTELRRIQYDHLIGTYHLEHKRFLEVGCGRGEFLKVLKEFPVHAFGMEHKTDLVQLAREQGLTVWQEFPETSDQVFAGGAEGKFDVFLSFNFLEHQPHPDVMLQAIYHNLAEDGMGLVTVPSLEYILEKGSYYELIRDHIAYYSFGTLRGLLEQNGFKVLEEEMINRDTISMIVKKAPLCETPADPAAKTRVMQQEKAALEADISVEPLVEGYQIVTEEIDALLRDLKQKGKTLAVWGASHQGFTLAATTKLKDHVEYIIDSAPFKQGRFAPASHLPILSPDDAVKRPVGAILIVAPGYTEEIAGIIRQRFGGDVETLTLRTNRIERL